MYKLRSKRPKKHRNNSSGRVAADGAGRVTGKREKKEGNANITSNRLTIPPGFLCLGIKSETVQRNKESDICRERNLILKEDLHGLFNSQDCKRTPVVRRSARILRKKVDQGIQEHSASDYYKQVIEDIPLHLKSNLENGKKPILKNKSKSLFQEINQRYLQLQTANVNFCSKLESQICINFQRKAILLCKANIFKMTEDINNQLIGKVTPQMELTPRNLTKDNFDNDIVFDYIPSSCWVYATPPKQRLQTPKLDNRDIEPAVIYSTQRQSTIYELKPDSYLDMNQFENRQPIPLDGRYVRYVGQFSRGTPTRDPEEFELYQHTNMLKNRYRTSPKHCDTNFNFLKPFPRRREPSPNLITRPIKTVERVSRIEMLKRKVDEAYNNTSTSSSVKRSSTFDPNLSNMNGILMNDLVCEETPMKFEFKRQLFKRDQQANMFSFKKESPKMFDFSNLKNNDY